MFQKHLQTTPSPVFSEPPISNAAELQACPTPGKPPLPKKLPASLPGAKASPFLPWTFCLFFFMGPVRTDWQKQTGEGSFPRTLEGASAGEGEVAVSALCLMPPVSAGRTHGCGDKVTAAPVLRRLRELLAPIPEPLFGPLEGVCVCVCVCTLSHSVMSHSLQPHGLQPTMLPCPRDFSGKNTRVGCHFLLQGLFLTHGSNLCLLHFLHW